MPSSPDIACRLAHSSCLHLGTAYETVTYLIVTLESLIEHQYPFVETLIKTIGTTDNMQLLDTIMNHYKEQQVVQFATTDGHQPRVRPMSLIHLDKHFYMITGARGGKEAKKLQQIRVNPRFEYYMPLSGVNVNGFIRGSGSATEVDDVTARKRVYDAIGWAREYFDTENHPDYILLELTHDEYSYRAPDTTKIKYLKL